MLTHTLPFYFKFQLEKIAQKYYNIIVTEQLIQVIGYLEY